MSWWSPRPLRPAAANPLFRMEEGPVVVKSLNPMQRQRQADGSPITRTSPTALRPPDPELMLRPELVKGSLVEKYDHRPEEPKQDPEDPMSVVKSYMAWDAQAGEKAAEVKKSAVAVVRMQLAINDLLNKAGTSAPKIPDEDAEDEEKALASPEKPAAKNPTGPSGGSVIGNAVRTVMGAAVKK